jgi:hypothetical protein
LQKKHYFPGGIMGALYNRAGDVAAIRSRLKREIHRLDLELAQHQRDGMRNISSHDFARLEQRWDAAKKMLSTLGNAEEVELAVQRPTSLIGGRRG